MPPRTSTSIKSLLFVSSIILFAISILAGMELWSGLHKVMVHVFLAFGLFLIFRQITLLFFAWKRVRYLSKTNTKDNQKEDNNTQRLPLVSIIIPAYNEQEVIADSLTSLFQLHYPKYEIIMVDDGSTDSTVALARELQQQHPRQKLTIITQTNAGKSSALNTGLRHASGELVLCVDSDSKISPDSIKWGVAHFSDPQVAAVAGHVQVANDNHLLTRFQQLEYLIGQNFMRRALSWFGVVTVIPGPVGLFRRDVVLELGGYSEDESLFAEDADLTVRLLSHGWKVVSEDRMVASTEAPEEIYPLLRQRYRWKRGIFQALYLNFKTLILAPQQHAPLIALLLTLEGFVLETVSFAITLFIIASFLRFGELKLLYGWFTLLFVLDVLVLMFAIGKSWWKTLPLLMLQKLLYGYALQAWNMFALIDEWRSTKMSWDKVERVGGLS